MTIYDFKAKSIDGAEIDLAQFKGKVLLIINTATKCGNTPQYAELESLYEKYKDKGLEILDFPCNQFFHQAPGTDAEIKSFCQLKYNVAFQQFSKIDVNGPNTHPLYEYLKENRDGVPGGRIKWNFTKFLINREGQVVGRFDPKTKPLEFEVEIAKLL